jgi:hypothetical protein
MTSPAEKKIQPQGHSFQLCKTNYHLPQKHNISSYLSTSLSFDILIITFWGYIVNRVLGYFKYSDNSDNSIKQLTKPSYGSNSGAPPWNLCVAAPRKFLPLFFFS